MCRSSLVCACDGEGSFERKVREGLPNMQPSPTLLPDPADFKVPEAEAEASSLLGELVQSQLALWTFSLSTIVTWLWQSRKRALLLNLCLLLPLALSATMALSAALAAFVTLGRFLFPQQAAKESLESSGVAEWVVKRLPGTLESQNAGFLRRRRSIHQHSLRSRRFRTLTSAKGLEELPPQPMKPAGYFWQRRLPSTTTAPCRLNQLRG